MYARRYFSGVLEFAALSHIVAAYCWRRPRLLEVARDLLRSVKSENDVLMESVVVHVLLGAPEPALDLLKEDERYGTVLR